MLCSEDQLAGTDQSFPESSSCMFEQLLFSVIGAGTSLFRDQAGKHSALTFDLYRGEYSGSFH